MNRNVSNPTELVYPSVETLQQEIARLYAQYRYPILTQRFNFTVLPEWAQRQAQRVGAPAEMADRRMHDLGRAIGSAQIGLGYMLWAKKFAKHPRGHKQRTYDARDVKQSFGLGDMHFWHHADLTVEAIYRVWERLTSLLRCFTFPMETEKFYFDGLVNKVAGSPAFSEMRRTAELKKHQKHWNAVAKIRNNLSHQSNRLFGEVETKVTPLRVLQPTGAPYFQFSVKTDDLVKTIEENKNRCLQCAATLDTVLAFIEELPKYPSFAR